MSDRNNPQTRLLKVCALLRNIAAVALLSALGFSAQLAHATQYFYSGRDATFSNIIMEIYITQAPAGEVVTGTVRCGNVLMLVKGMLAGNTLNADITSSVVTGTAMVTAATGTLNGALGTGVLNVQTGAVDINGRALSLSFALVPPSPVSPGSPVVGPPVPPPPPLASAQHLVGSTGFGYTAVALNLDLTLHGSSYVVNGFIVVTQRVMVRFQPVRTVQTTLRISGMLTPGVTGNIVVIGAPAGSSPRFAGTLSPTGTEFQGFLSGIPSLGITGLAIGARS